MAKDTTKPAEKPVEKPPKPVLIDIDSVITLVRDVSALVPTTPPIDPIDPAATDENDIRFRAKLLRYLRELKAAAKGGVANGR